MPLSGEITSPDVGRVLPDHDRGTSVKCQADGYGIDHVRELLRLSDVCDPRAIPDPSVKPARRAPERWGDRQRRPRLYPPPLLTGVRRCVVPPQIKQGLFGRLDPGTLVAVQPPRVSVAVIYQHGRLDPGTHGLPSCSAHDSSVSPLRIVTRGSSSSSSVSRSYSAFSASSDRRSVMTAIPSAARFLGPIPSCCSSAWIAFSCVMPRAKNGFACRCPVLPLIHGSSSACPSNRA